MKIFQLSKLDMAVATGGMSVNVFSIIKNLSILKKFLFINLIIFLFIGSLTIIYLSYVQPNLIKKRLQYIFKF